MYEKLLSSAGLSTNEAAIYEILLAESSQKASKIAKDSPLKRALVYKILGDLVAKGLAIKDEQPGEIATYTASHPDTLRQMAEQRAKEAETARQSIAGIIPQLASTYNLSLGKPGVRFFEGIAGFKQALFDSLDSTDTIYTYVDLSAMPEPARAINVDYANERKEKNIAKRLLLLDTPFARKLMADQNENTDDYKFLPASMTPFKTSLQIYNGKIAYYTLRDQNMISVIIEDRDIYATHRSLFEMIWELLDKKNTAPKSAYDMTDLNKYSNPKSSGL
ncbi:MAG: helix-turn-helix domain-containing protein [Candidatus Magasanikbacteria bacterium]|jgi:predicted transcriptional regulator